ncbi:MAG: dimethylarginine dimethylaminohydrolase family protein [Planctomycetota bacterium]
MRTARGAVYLLREVAEALAAYGSDVALARAQHAAYAAALPETLTLPADPSLPDGCFVEDTAVLEGERALLTRMGSPARRPESAAVGERLAALGVEVTRMAPPATLDGGDVLRIGDRVYVGLSRRTNRAGIRALEHFLGRTCTPVPVERCLHLKTACTAVAEGTVLLNPAWVDRAPFADLEVIEVEDPNALVTPDVCLVASAATAERAPGPVRLLDISEFEKAGGGLTCLSLPLAAR